MIDLNLNSTFGILDDTRIKYDPRKSKREIQLVQGTL
jgi:hypothetical protein